MGSEVKMMTADRLADGGISETGRKYLYTLEVIIYNGRFPRQMDIKMTSESASDKLNYPTVVAVYPCPISNI